MRVGIPHRGGKLAVHAFESGYPVMVSANTFFNYKTERFEIAQYSPLQDVNVTLDSTGFVAIAMMNIKAKGKQNGVGGSSVVLWRPSRCARIFCGRHGSVSTAMRAASVQWWDRH